MGVMVGRRSFLSKSGVIFFVSSEKTESNCRCTKSAFLVGSLVSWLLSSLRSPIPAMSCPSFLMYVHIFLFVVSAENMSLTYWSWTRLQTLCASLLIFLYIFASLPEPERLTFLCHLFFFLINLFVSVVIQG